MSDLSVSEALDAIEAVLAGPEAPSAEALAHWRHRFELAVASAERGPAWEGILGRAHALAEQVQHLGSVLAVRRDEVRRELEHQATGNRALRGYGAISQP